MMQVCFDWYRIQKSYPALISPRLDDKTTRMASPRLWQLCKRDTRRKSVQAAPLLHQRRHSSVLQEDLPAPP
jgi:hypothetical protein